MSELRDFDGKTWVAFSDLCGLKIFYKKDKGKALGALKTFYEMIYDLQRMPNGLSALAVSDCAIFWDYTSSATRQSVEPLLLRIKDLHKRMIEKDHLIRTTLAYGHFHYQPRRETPFFGKNLLLGSAYMDAYYANEKVEEGSIVVLPSQRALHPSIVFPDCAGSEAEFLKKEKSGWEYYWWVNSALEINDAREARKKVKNRAFDELKRVYRGELANVQ